MDKKALIKSALSAAIALGLASSGTSAVANEKAPETEKCYGIAKAQMNDCGTAKHSCGGDAKKDGDRSEWVFVTKGTCKKIVGGSLTPAATTAAPAKKEKASGTHGS